MNKVKIRIITIISIAVLFAVAFGFAIGTMNGKYAGAVSTYNTTAIFAQGDGGDVTSVKPDDDENTYTAFEISNKGNVYYRRNLALKWYEAAADENSEYVNPGQAHYFNLQFSFPELKFDTFTIAFESAEENVTKDGKTTNTLEFKNADGVLTAAVINSAGDKSEPYTVTDEWIDLSFTDEDKNIGEFAVLIGGHEVGTFTNIGGNYLEYRSSANATPNTPITFAAEMSEDHAEDVQTVLLRELNEQTLLVSEDGKVEDNKPAALVLNEKVYSFTLGKKFSLSYQAIDVCKDSVSVRREYYMLTESEGEDAVLGADSDYKTLTTSTFLMPTKDVENEEIYVSIRFKLDDGSVASADIDYVYLSWYAADNAVVTIGKDEENKFDYIKVDRNKQGPVYVGLEANESMKENVASDDTLKNAVDAYQDAVTAAAENASAGSGAYFYLPSLRGLITSDFADYRNLKFSVYYYNQTQAEGSSATAASALAYNALRFAINQEGSYKFRILAVDASGNGMQYYRDGELVTVTSSNIWDIEGIPEFEFEAKYTGVTIEDAGEQKLGYRDTVYSVTSFEVVALDGIDREYTLYYFDESKLPEGTSAPTYSDFVANIGDEDYRKGYEDCFKEINQYNSDITEDDEEWEKSDNAYAWNPSGSLSFCPQVSGYYIVELLVTDANRSNEVTTAYQVIEVRNPFDYTPGQSQWLQDNVISIVLFAVAAVLLVVIIVLFVVKPSDKKVAEVDLDKLKGKKKK